MQRVAFEHDGLVLRGAVVAVGRDGAVTVARQASSRAVEPQAALAEVVAALRAGGRLPARALVVTAEAIAALVRLPLPAGRARAPAEMAHMIRWELEPVFAQRAASRTLGAILIGRGDLTRRQVAEVLEAQEARSAGREAARFGDVACALGFVTDAQLRAALAIQQRLGAAGGDDYACGWTPQGGGAPGEATSSWLVAAVPRAARTRWSGELARHGLRLDGVYPLVGTAAAAVATNGRALLEVHAGALACATLEDGALAACEIATLADDEPVAEAARDLLTAVGAREPVVCGRGAADVAAALGGVTSHLELPGIAGAARHAAADTSLAVRIPARDAGPPLRRRPVVWWAAAAAVAALALGLAEFAMGRARARGDADLAAVLTPWRRVEAAVAAKRETSRRAGALAERITAERNALATLRERLARLGQGLQTRAEFLPTVLAALAEAASEEIVLDRVVEERPGAVRLEGWALSERAVQAFAHAAAARTRPLRVADQSFRAETVRGGAVRYAFSLLLAPPAPEDRP